MLINSYYANLFAKPLHKKTLSCTVIINSLKQWYNTIKYEIDLFTYVNARTNAKYSNYLETMHNLNIDLMSCYAVCVSSLGKANDDNELVKRVDKLRERYNNLLMKNKLLFWHSVEPQLIKLRNEFVNKDNKCGNSSSNYCNEVNDDDVVVEREDNIKINKEETINVSIGLHGNKGNDIKNELMYIKNKINEMSNRISYLNGIISSIQNDHCNIQYCNKKIINIIEQTLINNKSSSFTSLQ